MTDAIFEHGLSVGLPVSLVQELHQRAAWVRKTLQQVAERRAQLRAASERLEEELLRLTSLLDTYTLPELAAAVETPDAVPCSADRPRQSTLEEAIDTLLRVRGPSPAAVLRRALVDEGMHVPVSTLHDFLMRGLRERRYARSKQHWRLADEAPPAEEGTDTAVADGASRETLWEEVLPHVDSALAAHGPLSVPRLRQALAHDGVQVSLAFLHDLLMEGRRDDRYAKTGQIWRLGRGAVPAGVPEPAPCATPASCVQRA